MDKEFKNEEVKEKEKEVPFCHPSSLAHRCLIVIFLCLLVFGGYFCYDTPGALQDQIMNNMQVSTARYANLYALYSWPNVVLCFFGGFLIDRVFGIRWGSIIFGSAVLIGQLFVALGAFINIFWIMELGRFIFGVGLDSLIICQNTYAAKWFKRKQLNFVFGLQMSVARTGSTINFIVNPLVYNWISQSYMGHTALGISLFIVTTTCVFSMICTFILAYLDWHRDKLFKFESKVKDAEVISFKDIKSFPSTFWLLTAVCVCFYSAFLPYIGLGKVFFKSKYAMHDVTGWNSASTIDSVVFLIPTFASPLFGAFLSKTGQSSIWILISVLMTLFSFILLGFTFMNPWIPMIIMGFGYSIFAATMWPMVAKVMPLSKLATAYGLLQSVMNLGLGLSPMAAGAIVDQIGYMFLHIFFIDCLCAATIAATLFFLVSDVEKKPQEVNQTDKKINNSIPLASKLLDS